MKVRTKFTLWISLATLSTATFFSLFVYVELREEPYKLIDRELAEVAGTVFHNLDFSRRDPATNLLGHYDQHLERYWLKIFDSKGKAILVSPLGQHFDIALPSDRKSFFIHQKIPTASLWIDPDDADELDEITGDAVRFRVRMLVKTFGKEQYTLLIAKPLLFLDHELYELRTRLFTGIVATSILIFLMSCFLAGRILHPLTIINQNIKQIRENSLSRRLPFGVSRDELYVLTESLNSMFDRLQHSFSRQKEFIGNAAHELKSPLTILMLGQEEMLANRLSEPISSELEKQLNTMRRLSKLIRDLLDISRLEQDETCLREPVEITVLIRQVIEEYQDILQARNIAVETEFEEVPFTGDPDKLLRVIINLVDNAIKYNDETHGLIRIVTCREQERMIMTIANKGQGIPDPDLPRIFDQFYRVEKSRSQVHGGSGLGLTIVRRIVELHGGTIEVQSRNNWTTFTLILNQAHKSQWLT